MSETEEAAAEVRAFEAIAAKLEQRAAMLEAQIKAIADEHREQDVVSGLAGAASIRCFHLACSSDLWRVAGESQRFLHDVAAASRSVPRLVTPTADARFSDLGGLHHARGVRANARPRGRALDAGRGWP